MLNIIKAILCFVFVYYFADGWMVILVIALGLLAVCLTRYSKKLQAEQKQNNAV